MFHSKYRKSTYILKGTFIETEDPRKDNRIQKLRITRILLPNGIKINNVNINYGIYNQRLMKLNRNCTGDIDVFFFFQ